MGSLKSKPNDDDFKPGQRHISASDLHDVLQMLQRQILGDGKTIEVRAFGDRLIISAIPSDGVSMSGLTATVPIICDAYCDPETNETVITKKWLVFSQGSLMEILDEEPEDDDNLEACGSGGGS